MTLRSSALPIARDARRTLSGEKMHTETPQTLQTFWFLHRSCGRYAGAHEFGAAPGRNRDLLRFLVL
jgi:hypothetical protein